MFAKIYHSLYRISTLFSIIVIRSAIGHVEIDRDMGIIDLTHTLNNNTPFWGNEKSFELIQTAKGQVGDYWYESNDLSLPEHGGTHLDAPSHFWKGKLTAEKVPLENLIGPGVRINVRQKSARNPDYLVTVGDFEEWERKNGKIPDGAIILIDSGWSRHWPDPSSVFGTKTPKNVSTYHFPGLHPDGARWIVAERPKVKAIAIDTPSTDYGQSTEFMSHRILAEKNVAGFENVNMKYLTDDPLYVFAIPAKIEGGSGSPARVFAIKRSMCSSHGFAALPAVIFSILTHVAYNFS